MITDKEVIPLSIDKKPNTEGEMQRIVKLRGEVSQYEEDGVKSGPYRVWKKNEMYPGIAMSRNRRSHCDYSWSNSRTRIYRERD